MPSRNDNPSGKICRAIAEPPDECCAASIDLRAAVRTAAARRAEANKGAETCESVPPGRAPMTALRVLVVEDDAMIGVVLSEMLEELGCIVCALETKAANAVASARRCRPDLMIVDVGLGDASGVAAVEEILRGGFVQHVFVTGDALRGLSVAPDAVLIQKPFRESDIVQAIEQALAAKARRAILPQSI